MLVAKLFFYYSAMNAGKSTTLVQSNYNYHERGMDTLVFTPQIDTRFAKDAVSTRIGLKAPAIAFTPDFNFKEAIAKALSANANIRCILVDEAQFLTRDQVWQLSDVADYMAVPVLAYGLRTDFQGRPFPGSIHLLAIADQLIELKTICHCGSKATMNVRVDAQGRQVTEGNQVEIGGNERYLSACRRHFKSGVLTPMAQPTQEESTAP
jgi:thymidine kinase